MPSSSLFGKSVFGNLTAKEFEILKKKEGGSKRRGTKQKFYKMKGCSRKKKCKGGTKKKYHKHHPFVTYTGGSYTGGSYTGGQRGGCGNAMCPLTQGGVQGGGGRKKKGGGIMDYPSYFAGNIKGALLGSGMNYNSPNPTSNQFAHR
jgi:hypothetical protein